jgi:hypothetical protein
MKRYANIKIIKNTNPNVANLGAEYYVVIVSSQDEAVKYILSYHPNTVLSNKLQDFTIKNAINFQTLKLRIRQ